jgi:2-polyprenyl-6-methoxyphenol hydroxylase-like FAD-dependent oxidoreductase
MSRRIAIVGAGQAGLPLGIGLLEKGFAVTLGAKRSAEWVVTFNKGQYGSEW